MELLQAEGAVNLFFQSLGVWLAGPMRIISFLGQEEFYMVLLPFLFWVVDNRLGIRAGIMLLVTNTANASLKMGFHSPRPYWFDTRVHAYAAETSFGFPSGHAQISSSIWGVIGKTLRSRWLQIGILIMLLLIGISRLYLGVHYLRDVLGGWLTSAIILVLFFWLEKPVAKWWNRMDFSSRLWVALGSSLILIAIPVLVRISVSAWILPSEWAANALRAAPETAIKPFSLDHAFTAAGLWLGFLLGIAWMDIQYTPISTRGTVWQKVARMAFGLVVLFILWYGLGKVFPRTEDWLGFSLRMFRYALLGLWVTVFAPLLFMKFGWMQKVEKKASAG